MFTDGGTCDGPGTCRTTHPGGPHGPHPEFWDILPFEARVILDRSQNAVVTSVHGAKRVSHER